MFTRLVHVGLELLDETSNPHMLRTNTGWLDMLPDIRAWPHLQDSVLPTMTKC